MHLIYSGINTAFNGLISDLHSKKIRSTHSTSRYGDVLVVTEPLIVTYTNPRYRVLFNQARDCNCFFHLIEIIWLLAGRNDVHSLDYFNSKMKEFSDDGVVFHGSYGHRWRKHFGYDQLDWVIESLKKDKHSRRVVLEMWDAKVDGKGSGKDYPCNTHCYFLFNPNTQCLDLTVCNRSNDIVWGLLGANIVQMSCLLEYVSQCVGLPMGVYNQITNNAHVYVNNFEPEKWLADKTPVCYDHDIWQSRPQGVSVPLVKDPAVFDQECIKFIEMGQSAWTTNWSEPFLQTVVAPMCWAFRLHKERMYAAALDTIELVAAEDWRIAGRLWLEKRESAWRQKNA